MGITIITSLIALLVVAFALQGIKIVQQSETLIVERLGKYHGTLKSGLNIIIPFIDRPRQIIWRYSTEGPMGNTVVRYIKENRNLDLLEMSDDEEEFENINEDKFVNLKTIKYMKCLFNKKFKKWEPIEVVNFGEKLLTKREIQQLER